MSRVPSVCLILTLAVAAGCDAPDPITAPSPELRPRTLTAASVVVQNANDAGPGSLRQAIADAQEGETIQFDPALAGQTITLTTGSLFVLRGMTIEGPTSAGITISGNRANRVFHTTGTGVVLRNLTITGGKLITPGAGVFNGGTLTIDHSVITGNETTGAPTVPGFGGGVYNGSPGELTVINSTISGNTAADGGGGIYSTAPLAIINSTIAYNDAGAGSGVSVLNGPLLLRNALIANNAAADCAVSPLPSSDIVTYEGTNLSSDASCGLDPAMLVGDPMLGPLASNGGPTQTHALLIGSPAVEAAAACTVTTDQRYVARPQLAGGACDIGAYEFTAFLQVSLAIDASATVNPKSGIAVVSGTISCGTQTPAELEIRLAQPQKVGRVSTTIQATDLVTVDCVGKKYWSVALAPASGGFQTGAATATVSTTKLDKWYQPATATKTVKLYWGRK